MRNRVLAILVCSAVALSAWFLRHSAADPPPAAPAQPLAPVAAETIEDWKDDPVCQMVFFAVLEGLYSDGVPQDVIDSLVPRVAGDNSAAKGEPAAREKNPVKANFVVECPLCHPVYEALSLYQRRAAFQDGDGKRSTFGKGIKQDLRKQLTNESRKERLTALRTLVHRWVDRRLTLMRLTDKEKAEWTEKLRQRSSQGRNFLSKLMRSDPDYQGDWSLYWGCAACNGTTDACNKLLLVPKAAE